MPQKCIVKEMSLQKLYDETQRPVIIGVNACSCRSAFVKISISDKRRPSSDHEKHL